MREAEKQAVIVVLIDAEMIRGLEGKKMLKREIIASLATEIYKDKLD
ncbi:hypothetical protein [Ectobacillus panaciterrae]|nr:hypothetical protein [Ectobacillus panaciterrae]